MSMPKRDPAIFKKIIGYEYVKQEFLSILFVLDNRKEFSANGVTIPRGMLLYGDYPIINEYLSKNLVTESGYHLYSYDGDDDALIEFYKSTESDKNYILYITDFDKKVQDSSSDFPKILASIMECVDNDNIFVIATAEDADEIPKEWFQPLRFFRKIGVYLQSYSEAVSMLQVLCEKKNLPELVNNEDFYGLLANSPYQLRKNKNCIKPKDGSLLRKANDISCSIGSVYLTLIDGTILVGKSLGFEPDYDADGNQLPENVLCFESFVSGGIYIFTEEEITNVA